MLYGESPRTFSPPCAVETSELPRGGYASRLLVDSHTNVAEICYSCGFNNISNFNRIFKKKKGCSPTAFRDNYHKSKIII